MVLARGGMPFGFEFEKCPKCGKKGVSLRSNFHPKLSKQDVVYYKACRYCDYYEVES
jgi:hypothetical protein